MTGGSTPLDGGQRFQFFSDLWAWTDSGWHLVSDSGDQRSGFAMAYDDARHEVWSVGGYNGQSLDEVRVLRQNRWVVRGRHPNGAAAEPGFVYDQSRDRFVLFGGSEKPGQQKADTWEFDGTTWFPVSGTNPPARQAHAMVYDQTRHVTLLFGGMAVTAAGQRPTPLGDTWQYDARGWTRVEVQGPSPRFSSGVAFDAKRGVVVLFGGLDSSGFLGDTWTWNGKSWRLAATTGPEARAMGYLAYDPKHDRVVLFGGRKGWPDGDLADTWEWDGARWTQAN